MFVVWLMIVVLVAKPVWLFLKIGYHCRLLNHCPVLIESLQWQVHVAPLITANPFALVDGAAWTNPSIWIFGWCLVAKQWMSTPFVLASLADCCPALAATPIAFLTVNGVAICEALNQGTTTVVRVYVSNDVAVLACSAG
jgi:hypothetical protein